MLMLTTYEVLRIDFIFKYTTTEIFYDRNGVRIDVKIEFNGQDLLLQELCYKFKRINTDDFLQDELLRRLFFCAIPELEDFEDEKPKFQMKTAEAMIEYLECLVNLASRALKIHEEQVMIKIDSLQS